MVNLVSIMVNLIKVNGKIIKSMEKEHSTFKMETFIKVNFKMVKKMVKEK